MERQSEILVSVIVAIYKVEDYLEQCVQSIIDQTYRNIEIILVDDGSPDRCPAICDGFSKRDSRVYVTHKENEGSVYARRTGLLKATGQYVLMVDGDDYMDPHYIENLVRTAEKNAADVVVDSFMVSYPNREFVEKIYHQVGTYRNDKLTEMKRTLIYAGTYFRFGINPALWNKLFRRDELLRYYLDIPKQLTLGEDFAVSIPFMACAECISVIDSDAYYHYRQRENSMVRAYDPKLNQKVGCLVDYLRQQENLKLFDTQLNYYYSWLYMSCMKNDAAIKCKFFDMAKALEKTSHLFNEIVRLDDLRELTFKYSIIFTLIKYKHWKMLALLFQIKKAAR